MYHTGGPLPGSEYRVHGVHTPESEKSSATLIDGEPVEMGYQTGKQLSVDDGIPGVLAVTSAP
jgi:hypothetical protein